MVGPLGNTARRRLRQPERTAGVIRFMTPVHQPVGRRPRRQQVLDVARRLLAAQGYAGLVPNTVAGSAGLSPARVTALFPDRRALLIALAEDDIGAFEERFAHEIARGATLEAIVRSGCAALIGWASDHRGEYRPFFSGADRLDQAVTARLATLRQRLATLVSRRLQDAVADDGMPSMAPAETRLVVFSILGLAEGSLLAWLGEDMATPEHQIEQVLAGMILRVLRPQRDPSSRAGAAPSAVADAASSPGDRSDVPTPGKGQGTREQGAGAQG